MDAGEMKNIPPANIESINVLKGESAKNKYGEKGKNGVVEITMTQERSAQKDTIPDKLFTKVENEAEFEETCSTLIQDAKDFMRVAQNYVNAKNKVAK